MPDKEPDSTGSEPGPIPFLMRYAKLGAGVLLAVIGAVATVGAVGGWIAYVATCMGPRPAPSMLMSAPIRTRSSSQSSGPWLPSCSLLWL